MSLLQNSNAISEGGGYNLENSLRFRSSASAYLSRTPATAGNSQKMTWSFWVKPSKLATEHYMFSAGTGNSGWTDLIRFQSTSEFQVILADVNSQEARLIPAQVFRDPSAWYHIIVSIDTTQATSSNRINIYINGEKVTVFNTEIYPAQNFNILFFNKAIAQKIGHLSYASSNHFDGYMTEINFIDGQALTASDFGETNAITGVWQPIEYTGTYGTNGFYLKGRGTDNSGNGNNWTENNFNTTNSALTTYDIMTDVPTLTDEDTANYCTLNPIRYGIYPGAAAVTLSEANLKAAWSTDPGTLISTINIPTTGKWYWEAVVPTQTYNFFAVGVVKNQETTNLNNFVGTTGYAAYMYNGLKYILGTGSAYMASTAQNTVITVAFDADTGTLYIGAGGSWANGSGSTNQSFSSAASIVTGLTGDISPAFSFNSGNFIVNFGQRPFAYTPPTGYKKLNTYNLPDSSIVDGSENFNTVLYSGTGATQSITGVNFQPDWVWLKSRSNAANHGLHDVLRVIGSAEAMLSSNTTGAETTGGAYISSFDTDGFTVNNNSSGNGSGQTYVSWNWKAGGTAVSNTDGTITSSVSANPTAGFSVVTYTGNGTTATVGHGLGVAPQMVITKGRTNAFGWGVQHIGLTGGNNYLALNSTAAQATDNTQGTITNATSTTVQVGRTAGASSWTNATGVNYVAYAFAGVEGYSKFGSYTGNGSADGTFVYTGFKPKMVIIKVTSAAFEWVILDTERNPENLVHDVLYPSISNAEADATTYASFDAVSNGFKLRNSHQYTNFNGYNYIYMAFAENPFKNSLAR